ncbi:MAG: hypothetical protein ACE5MM_09080 [Nitrospiraceae bacterium]
MKRLALIPFAAFGLAACQDTTQPEKDGPTSLAPFSSFQVYALGTPDIIVNTTSDVVDFTGAQRVGDLSGPDGDISLREAIIAANNTAGPQVIGFNIPDDDPGFDGTVFTIHPLITLPDLTDDGTTIDGATQANFTGNTNPAGPEVVLNGSALVTPGNGLFVFSSGNMIRGLVINGGFAGGVLLDGPRNIVENNFIGTDPSGTTAVPNAVQGIVIFGGSME